MAQIVVGLGTSHSPMLSMPPKFWHVSAEYDRQPGRELMSPKSGRLTSFPALLAEADPAIAGQLTEAVFQARYEAIQRGIATLQETLRAARADVAIVIGADQEEYFFDNNMPALAIYWGASWRLKPWTLPDGVPEAFQVSASGYGTEVQDCAIDTGLAEHLIVSLTSQDFEVSTIRYTEPAYGGTVGPAGYLDIARATKPRALGMGHAWAFVVSRVMNGATIPFVPIMVNTCYPPNQPRTQRCYDLGRSLGRAVASWKSDKRVAVIASGGLSHFVVDEELDRAALAAMRNNDVAAMNALPEFRLQSAASEIKIWICAAGALKDLSMDVIAYVPCRRTPAGTGGGWGFAQWI